MQQGDEDIVLKVAKLCYVEEKYKLNKIFQSIMEKTFRAQAQGVNFGDPKTRKKINSHVEELTNKKIEDLLSKGNEEFRYLNWFMFIYLTLFCRCDRSGNRDGPRERGVLQRRLDAKIRFKVDEEAAVFSWIRQKQSGGENDESHSHFSHRQDRFDRRSIRPTSLQGIIFRMWFLARVEI